jgi:hypothetical protein
VCCIVYSLFSSIEKFAHKPFHSADKIYHIIVQYVFVYVCMYEAKLFLFHSLLSLAIWGYDMHPNQYITQKWRLMIYDHLALGVHHPSKVTRRCWITLSLVCRLMASFSGTNRAIINRYTVHSLMDRVQPPQLTRPANNEPIVETKQKMVCELVMVHMTAFSDRLHKARENWWWLSTNSRTKRLVDIAF